MADRKITDLTALTTPASADVLPIVDVSEAAAADKNKKVTVGELFKGIPDGTAAAPAIAFESDDGNGFFLSTTDTIGIATNGVSRATVSTTAVTSTLPVIVPDGSAAAPSVAFTGSGTDTGLYSPGADQVAISTNGTGRLFIDSSGRVGVGTTSPGGELHVRGSATASYIRFDGATGNGAYNHIYGDTDGVIAIAADPGNVAANSHIKFQIDSNERLRITSGGLVGVGTSSPAALLHLSSSANTTLRLADTAGSYSDIIYNESGSVSQLILDADPTGSSVATGGTSILLKTDGSTAMTIDSSQRVGIGTTSPSRNLTVSDTTANPFISIEGSNTSSPGLLFGDTDNNAIGQIRYDHSVDKMRFSANGAERATIDSSGRLGIGENSPDSTVTIKAAASTTPLRISGPSSEFVRVDSAGRLLVGTSSTLAGATDSLLQIRGNSSGSQFAGKVALATEVAAGSIVSGTDLGAIYFGNVANGIGGLIECKGDAQWGTNDYPGRLVFSTTADGASSPTERMRITSDGSLFLYTLSGSVSAMANIKYDTSTKEVYYDTSSRLAKENIADLKHGLDAVKAIQPRTYTAINGDPNQEIIGFIADELVSVVPEAVFSGVKSAITGNDEDTEIIPLGISYDSLIPVLVKALQEATAKIETLEARLTAAGIE